MLMEMDGWRVGGREPALALSAVRETRMDAAAATCSDAAHRYAQFALPPQDGEGERGREWGVGKEGRKEGSGGGNRVRIKSQQLREGERRSALWRPLAAAAPALAPTERSLALRARRRERGLSGKSRGGGAAAALVLQSVCERRPCQTECLHGRLAASSAKAAALL